MQLPANIFHRDIITHQGTVSNPRQYTCSWQPISGRRLLVTNDARDSFVCNPSITVATSVLATGWKYINLCHVVHHVRVFAQEKNIPRPSIFFFFFFFLRACVLEMHFFCPSFPRGSKEWEHITTVIPTAEFYKATLQNGATKDP